MSSQHAFTVYNAAAGAGKTYTLVKAYLTTLLTAEYTDGYKNILAITFTNKAVAEMKTRVLENLVALSGPSIPEKYVALLKDLIVETGLEEEQLKKKASRILKSVLHNYAAFDVVTIDTFTHRVIRTFAHDLGIPINFEIEMDTEVLIEEAVDALVARIGLDQELTQLILDFAIGKLEDDKSWDITIELRKAARLLFSENDRKHLQKLSGKDLKDFETLKDYLSKEITQIQNDIVLVSNEVLQLIKQSGLVFEDFTRSSVPTHFQKLANKEKGIDFKAAWKQDIGNASFYGAKLEETKKEAIDAIRSRIEEAFLETKNNVIQISFFQNVIKNVTPLAVLNAIHKELDTIKKERKILLISEFNTLISTTIQDQPAPFIYERLGERYRDYFIDEFQDTSELQWNNLIPLIDNAVATETLMGKRGQITIVGDAKQAIYRWRGGKAEQFIDLSADENPFSVKEKQVLNLPKNYRSHEEIIKFNNSFFSFLAKDFSDKRHEELYLLGNKQETNTKKEGFINVSFIEAKNVTEENEVYPQRVYEQVLELQEKGYALNEVCIIVRKLREGTAIADYLTEKEVPIISSETLLIQNAPEVVFVVDLMSWYVEPNNLLAKINLLHFIAERSKVKDKHSFLQKMVFLEKKDFSNQLESLGIHFDMRRLDVKPLYDLVEYIISCFQLATNTPAYLQFFLDIVFNYSQKYTEGIVGFLLYWEDKRDKLSIVAPEAEEAVKIMTIHKSKGLEFPCVIYPYANEDIYREIEPKTWLSVPKERYVGFEEVFIDYSKKIIDYGTEAENIVLKRQAQLELDVLNLLYVVLTRAKEQLYIISKKEINAKGVSNPNKFSGKLIAYLQELGLWREDQLTYQFGYPKRASSFVKPIAKESDKIKLSGFSDSSKSYKIHIVTNSGKLWDTKQEDAIAKGNLIHDLMAKVYVSEDIHTVIEEAYVRGEIEVSQKKTLLNELTNVVTHPELTKYFSANNKVFNERDIISEGKVFRPDRVTIDTDGLATIIDYKTGIYSETHAKQITEYAHVLQKMGFNVGCKILIYFNENITLKYL